MAKDFLPQPADPTGGDPVVFSPETFARHTRAIANVEGQNNARYPRVGRGRTTKPSPGAWGYLKSGHVITGVDRLILGSGTVTLCSRDGTTLTADGEDVTVYNSGSEISGPLAMELEWTDGDWAVCVCPGTAPPCTPCICNMRQGNLTITWSGGTAGSGSSTLAYDLGANHWTGNIGSDGNVVLECNGFLSLSYLGGACVWPQGDGVDFTDFLCDPLSIHYVVSIGIDEASCVPPDSLQYKDLYISGGTDGACPQFDTTVFVSGCTDLPVSGVSVVVKDAGGATIATGTTNSSGIMTVTNQGMAGGSIITSKARFTGFTKSPATLSGSTTVGGPTAGYACMFGCADPAATTLHATFSIAGAVTLTYGSGAWSGTVTVAGSVYAITLTNFDDGAGDLTVVATITKDGVDCGDVTYTQVSCPPSYSATLDIPAGDCGDDLGTTASISE